MGVETVHHFLFYCPLWVRFRASITDLGYRHNRWGDTSFFVGGWSGASKDGEEKIWKPNMEAVWATLNKYELIVNNNTDFPTRPRSQGISIIDLALTTASLGPLTLWEIPEEYPSLSDHELILLQWEDLRQDQDQSKPAINTGWNIQALLEDEALLLVAKEEWEKKSSSRPCLSLSSSKKDLDSEVERFEAVLGGWMDKHAKVTRVTSFSKRWWNDEVAQERKTWAKEKRRLGNCSSTTEDLKKA